MKELRCLSATGQLGFGMPEESFWRGVEKKPHFIGADMGSTDLGPLYLGTGQTAATESGIYRDLKMVLAAGHQLKVPVIIGSAGTAGTDLQVDKIYNFAKEISESNGWKFKTAKIYTELSKDYVLKRLKENGAITNLSGVHTLTEKDVRQTSTVVAQPGYEPLVEALEEGVDLVIAGRVCDTSIFAAFPIMKGYNPGLALHMGKIIECASLCAVPGGRDAIMGYLREDHFDLESQNPNKSCTPKSVAAHALYEQEDPYIINEPIGSVDLSQVRYEKVDDRITRVFGSRFNPTSNYRIKIEGSARVGHRYVAVGGVRDPILINRLDEVEQGLKELVEKLLPPSISPDSYQFLLRYYGLDGVMGKNTPEQDGTKPREIGVMIDIVAQSPEVAKNVCALARYNFMHYFYPGIKATAGNLALPFSPPEMDAGPVYRFSIYHLMEVSSLNEFARIQYEMI